jgi:hypothetical protein
LFNKSYSFAADEAKLVGPCLILDDGSAALVDNTTRLVNDDDLNAWFRTKAARAVGTNDVDKHTKAVTIVLDPKAEALFVFLQLIG